MNLLKNFFNLKDSTLIQPKYNTVNTKIFEEEDDYFHFGRFSQFSDVILYTKVLVYGQSIRRDFFQFRIPNTEQLLSIFELVPWDGVRKPFRVLKTFARRSRLPKRWHLLNRLSLFTTKKASTNILRLPHLASRGSLVKFNKRRSSLAMKTTMRAKDRSVRRVVRGKNLKKKKPSNPSFAGMTTALGIKSNRSLRLKVRVFRRLRALEPPRYINNLTRPYTWTNKNRSTRVSKQTHPILKYFTKIKFRFKRNLKKKRSRRMKLTKRQLNLASRTIIVEANKPNSLMTCHSNSYKTNTSCTTPQNPHAYSSLATKENYTLNKLLLVVTDLVKKISSDCDLTLRKRYRNYTQSRSPVPLCQENLLFIEPKHLRGYVIRSVGFFLVRAVYKHRPSISWDTKAIRKKLSFFLAGEFKQELVKSKRKIKYSSLLFGRRRKINKMFTYSFGHTNSLFSSFFATQVRANAHMATFSGRADPSTGDRSSAKIGYRTRTNSLVDNNYYKEEVMGFRKIGSDIRLPRVKFKPGYQRIWRHAREALKESLGLRFVYQQQLTRHLAKFFIKHKGLSFLNENKISLANALIYTHFFPDLWTMKSYMQLNVVFLNGRLADSLETLLIVNDFMQVTVSLWFYLMNRWVTNWSSKRHERYRRLMFLKSKAYKYKLVKTRKRKSHHYPNWIFNYKLNVLGIKQYFEVDFLTLSAFVVFDPNYNFYENWREDLEPRVNIYRMYNWKYVN